VKRVLPIETDVFELVEVRPSVGQPHIREGIRVSSSRASSPLDQVPVDPHIFPVLLQTAVHVEAEIVNLTLRDPTQDDLTVAGERGEGGEGDGENSF